MPQKKDYYGTLGVSRDASLDDIKKAYRLLVKEWHPDRHFEDKKVAEEKFKEIQEAYEVLSDPEKKKLYDRFGFVPENGGMPNSDGYSGSGGFEDVFKDIFGEGRAGTGPFSDFFDMFFNDSSSKSQRRTSQPPQKGEDIRVNVTMDMREVLEDTQKTIEYNKYEACPACHGNGSEHGTSFRKCPRCNGEGTIHEEQRTFFGVFVKTYPCPTCNGLGKIIEKKCSVCSGAGKTFKNEKFIITIPSGVEDGFILRVTGKGNSGKNGGPNGDLLVGIRINSDKRFIRKGTDLETQVDIDYLQALLGDRIKIPTLEGDVYEKISEGTSPNTVVRLKGLGIPDFRTKKRGDIYVRINVKIDKPSIREKKLLKELAQMRGISAE